jgi:hypothetical protein
MSYSRYPHITSPEAAKVATGRRCRMWTVSDGLTFGNVVAFAGRRIG